MKGYNDFHIDKKLVKELKKKESRKKDTFKKRLYYPFFKRTADIFCSLVCLCILIILFPFIAIAIKSDSKGPIFFTQIRIGKWGQPFKIYKLRTMVVDAEDKVDSSTFLDKDNPFVQKEFDDRVTKVGAFLRKYSIDELPQLFNVLKGDMSLVGPRPERPQFVEKFREEIPRYMVKHQVRPGMTGWAQINGYRGDTSIRKRIEYDLYYIENWTVGLDLKILFLTCFKGFINKNAY